MDIDEIKRLTLQGIMKSDILMYGLILKGGNALHLGYNISNRGSIDIDFSMENDFSDDDFRKISNGFSSDLNSVFNSEGIQVYDVKFKEKPKHGSIKEWKGYMLEFKLISIQEYLKNKNNIDKIRRESIKINNQSTKYTVDISSYEYVKEYNLREIDGLILKVYTPEMILIEKLRALCQSMPEYKNIVHSASQKQRARDIYDIHLIKNSFPKLNITKELVQNIFDAKRVPINFLENIEDLRDLNRNGWNSVQQTIDIGEDLESYDFYFDEMKKTIDTILNL